MRRDSVMTRFYKELPTIICISTLFGCCLFTFFHLTAYIISPPENPVVKEFTHRLKTEGPTSAQQFLVRAGSPNSPIHYDVLDIPWFSPVETVKKAYREKLMIYHPDKFGGDEEEANMKIHQAREAYQVLTSKERCMYDYKLGSGIRHLPTATKHGSTGKPRCSTKSGKKRKKRKKRKREEGDIRQSRRRDKKIHRSKRVSRCKKMTRGKKQQPAESPSQLEQTKSQDLLLHVARSFFRRSKTSA